MQRLLILGSGEVIGVEEVEAAVGPHRPRGLQATHATPAAHRSAVARGARAVRESLSRPPAAGSNGNVGKLAKQVGMERTHLYRKLRTLGIEIKKGGDVD